MKGPVREENLAKTAYLSDEYFAYSQLWSFSEQIYQINLLKPVNMLEIGVGNGFVSRFLENMGVNVTTLDINPALDPDIVAPVDGIADYVTPNEFDLIVCCEVLEHLPFEEFEGIIEQFSRLSPRLFLTIPTNFKYIGFGGFLKFPGLTRWLGLWLEWPLKHAELADMHFWEIGYDRKTSQKKIMETLNKYYSDVETDLFKANPYHRYFRCTRA